MESATAQDAKETKEARLEAPAPPSDDARLAAVGITAATIDQEADVEALWRAVRELVLPGLVSEAMQQRILRRVWMVDPAIRDAPVEPFTAD